MSETAAFDAAVTEAEPETVAPTLPFCGEQIPVKALPTIALLKFSKMAVRKIGTRDAEGMAAMYDVITSVVLPEALDRFEQLARENAATEDDLLGFVALAIKTVTGRPTVPPSASQESASTDSSKSKPASRVIDLGEGRIVEIQPGETTAAATARALLMEPAGEEQTLDGIQEATLVAVELHSD